MATASALPRTPRSFNASQPPTSALPALPHGVQQRPSLSNLRSPKSSLLPTSPRRTSSTNFGLAQKRPPSLTVQSADTLTTKPAMPSPKLSPRRTVSIASFPQPPRKSPRVSSLPPPSNPLGCQQHESSPLAGKSSRLSLQKSPALQNSPRISSNLTPRFSSEAVGLGVVGLGVVGERNSSGSYISGAESRSSSAQGSYSTTATTIEASPSSDDGGKRGDEKGNVIVSMRVRPDGPDGMGGLQNPEWDLDSRDGRLGYTGKDGGTYEYDNVFSPQDDNLRVYESCAKRLVRRVMEGYHGTVFAYGMTGTGKTFSMQGIQTSPGVIPLAITDIFSFIRETPTREFLLRVSYLEIYNERIHDLLASQPGGAGFVPLDQQVKGEEIKLREDPKRGVYATPLKEEIVQSPTQLLKVIARGDMARKVGSTQYNARSSRSHAVVQIVVESRERVNGVNRASMQDNRRTGTNGGVRVSTLSLIDLAGSERAAEDKERRTEGAHINKSLLTLGNIMAKLSKDATGKDKDYLPYRDSKLTRLLQGALSGNSLVSILCTVAIPTGANVGANAVNIGETLNTMKFAARAKNNIVSRAKKADESFAGGVDPGARALLDRYRSEIQELRKELETQKRREDQDLLEREEDLINKEKEKAMERHGEQMLEMQLARTALKERIEHLNRLILCSKSSGVNHLSWASPHASFINAGHLSALSMRSASTPVPNHRNSSAASSLFQRAPSDSDSDTGELNDGNASLAERFEALQRDLRDRNRYIETLEQKLLRQKRLSDSISNGTLKEEDEEGVDKLVPEGRVELLLKDKDDEIRELRERLEDRERMVKALRNAARKLEIAEGLGTVDEGDG